MEREEQELTVAEVARRLRVSERTVKRRIKAGLLRARKEGKLLRITKSDLADYIESTYQKGQQDGS
jgi:excisionase family DNA binding protein